MKNLELFIQSLPNVLHPEEFGVYPLSINQVGKMWVFMLNEGSHDSLIVVNDESNLFQGSLVKKGNVQYLKAELTHENGNALRKLFPFTKPIPVLNKMRSFGLGDRLGISGPGHIKTFKNYDAYPVFVQQSIRELNLTNRTYEEVLDSATFFVFRDGYKDGFGADGDHLKKPQEIEYALSLGFTMVTLDCSDYINNEVGQMTSNQIDKSIVLDIIWRHSLYDTLKSFHTFVISSGCSNFSNIAIPSSMLFIPLCIYLY